MPYACIALQELNLAYHYPIIYWNCGCLIVDAGADEEVTENKSTDYGKIATAMSNMQHRGIDIAFPLINEAEFEFTPDEKNNRIIYSLKAINGIGDDVVREIINQRKIKRFESMDDFYSRMYDTGLVKKSQMIQLIKAGAFIDLDSTDRRKTMNNFLLTRVVSLVEKLGFAQFDRMITFDKKQHFILEDQKLCIRHKYFKEYILNEAFLYKNHIDQNKKIPKKGYHDRWFKLDQSAMSFFQQYYSEESVEDVAGNSFVISEKKFLKEYEKNVQSFKEWLQKPETIVNYNRAMYQEALEKYASGSIPKWEMDSLTVYMGQHELADVQFDKYGVVNFFEQPDTPVPVSYYTKNVAQVIDGVKYKVPKELPIYQIVRLAGTVIDKNKDRHLVTLLTVDGVVTLKFNKGQFLYYDKQISEVKEDGTKERKESSWFSRGNKILVTGYRNGDQFRIYKYANSIYKHTCYLIKEVKENGDITVATERVRLNDGE